MTHANDNYTTEFTKRGWNWVCIFRSEDGQPMISGGVAKTKDKAYQNALWHYNAINA